MSDYDWARIIVVAGASTVVLAFFGRVMGHSTKAIWNLVRAWQEVVPGFHDVASQLADIKELLRKGQIWMEEHDVSEERQDADFAKLEQRVFLLETK